jgi:hypothetical protein
VAAVVDLVPLAIMEVQVAAQAVRMELFILLELGLLEKAITAVKTLISVEQGEVVERVLLAVTVLP